MTIYSFDVLLSQFGTGLFFHEVWLIYKNLYIVKVYNLKSFGAKYISMTEKAMAPHSSTPVWKIPWTEEPSRLQSIGSLRVRHDWVTELNWTDWIIKKAREFQKNIYFCFIDYTKVFDCVSTTNCGKFFKRWEYRTTLPVSWETCMQVKKQQL